MTSMHLSMRRTFIFVAVALFGFCLLFAAHAAFAATNTSVLVQLVNYSDKPASCNVTQANTAMFGPDGAAALYKEASFDQHTMSGKVLPAVTINVTSTTACDVAALTNIAQKANAANAASNPLSYTKRVYVIPHTPKCMVGGKTVGGIAHTDETTGIGSDSYVIGNACSNAEIYVHEIGHLLTLEHANIRNAEGIVVPYGDASDPMGWNEIFLIGETFANKPKQFNAPNKVKLKYLNPVALTKAGEYTVAPLEAYAPATPRVMTIDDTLGDKKYWFSYRIPTGFDDTLNPPHVYTLQFHSTARNFLAAPGTSLFVKNFGSLGDGKPEKLWENAPLTITTISHDDNSLKFKIECNAPTDLIECPKKAVRFDGKTYLKSDTFNVSNAGKGTASVWLRSDSSNSVRQFNIFQNGPWHVVSKDLEVPGYLQFNAKIAMNGANNSWYFWHGGFLKYPHADAVMRFPGQYPVPVGCSSCINPNPAFSWHSSSPSVPWNKWTHFLISWDTSRALVQVYLNDQVVPLSYDLYATGDNRGKTPLTMDLSKTVGLTLLNLIQQEQAGQAPKMYPFVGDAMDLWVNFGSNIDLSVEANRRKFITAEKGPVYLGKNGERPASTTPTIFMTAWGATSAAEFAINKGTGGPFMLGAVGGVAAKLSFAPTFPSDTPGTPPAQTPPFDIPPPRPIVIDTPTSTPVVLSVSPAEVFMQVRVPDADRTVSVSWSGFNPVSTYAQIALFPATTTTFNSTILNASGAVWAYVNSCTKTRGSSLAASSGSCSIVIPLFDAYYELTKPGDYIFGLFADGSYGAPLAKSGILKVYGDVRVTVTPASVIAGSSSVQVSWSNFNAPSTRAQLLLKLYSDVTTGTSLSVYMNSCASTMGTTLAPISGSCSIPIPTDAIGGSYYFKLLPDGQEVNDVPYSESFSIVSKCPARNCRAVYFNNGATYLHNDTMDVSKAPRGTLSVWLRSKSPIALLQTGPITSSGMYITERSQFHIISTGFDGRGPLDLFASMNRCSGFPCTTGPYVGWKSATTPPVTDAWTHVLISWDIDARVAQMYINDRAESFSLETYDNPSTINMAGSYGIRLLQNAMTAIEEGSNESGRIIFEVSDLWVNLGSYVDLSVEFNRRKFITADKKAVFLGENGEYPLLGVKSTMFFTAAGTSLVTDFGINRGSGGAFQLKTDWIYSTPSVTYAASAPAMYFPPPPATLTLSPATSFPGGSVTLSWSNFSAPSASATLGLFPATTSVFNSTTDVTSIYANTCTTTAGTTAPGSSGSCTFSIPGNVPSSSYVFALVNSPSGVPAAISPSFSIAVPATITASPMTLAAGATQVVSWSGIPLPNLENWFGLYPVSTTVYDTSYQVYKYVSCTNIPTYASVAASGSCNVSLPTTAPAGAYKWVLFGNYGHSNPLDESDLITISATGAATATITASPTSITAGQSSTLTWSSTNATSCTGSGFTASGTSGSVSATPSVTTTYSITCAGAGGSANKSTTVTVSATPPTFSPDGTSITPTSGTQLKTSHGTWTFGAKHATNNNYAILLNGAPASTGYGTSLYVAQGGQVFTMNASNATFKWSGSAWQRLAISADGTTITAPSGTLVTTRDLWYFGTATTAGGNAILRNGSLAAGGYGVLLVIAEGGNAFTQNQGAWYKWTGTEWEPYSGDPRSAIPAATLTASPDGSSITPTSGSSLTTSHGTWTFGAKHATNNNYAILLNGAAAATGQGTTLYTAQSGQMFTVNAAKATFKWTGSVWKSLVVSTDGSTITPTTTNGMLVTSGNTWTFSTATMTSGTVILMNGKSTGSGGNLLLVYQTGLMFMRTTQNTWYKWDTTTNTWVTQSGDPRTVSATRQQQSQFATVLQGIGNLFWRLFDATF